MYDEIASLYHLVYEDWDQAITQQSSVLHQVAVNQLGRAPLTVLDVSCGIGTQALGFAELGCRVSASDLSRGAVERAIGEAKQREVSVQWSVADMRDCFDTHGDGYDLVLSADNSIPHLPGNDEVARAVLAMTKCAQPGGLVVIGIRDYKPDEKRTTGQVFTYGTRHHEGHRYFVFQTRDWQGDAYDVCMYFVQEESDQGPASVVSGRSRYYAIPVAQLLVQMTAAGLQNVQRLDGVAHNVLVTGTKPG